MRKAKKPIPQELREKVFKRDDYTCQYCGDKTGPFHCDHVYPESKGGETSLENLVTACRSCNGRKQAKVGIWPRKIITLKEKEKIIEKVIVTRERKIFIKKPIPIGLILMFSASFILLYMTVLVFKLIPPIITIGIPVALVFVGAIVGIFSSQRSVK